MYDSKETAKHSDPWCMLHAFICHDQSLCRSSSATDVLPISISTWRLIIANIDHGWFRGLLQLSGYYTTWWSMDLVFCWGWQIIQLLMHLFMKRQWVGWFIILIGLFLTNLVIIITIAIVVLRRRLPVRGRETFPLFFFSKPCFWPEAPQQLQVATVQLPQTQLWFLCPPGISSSNSRSHACFYMIWT